MKESYIQVSTILKKMIYINLDKFQKQIETSPLSCYTIQNKESYNIKRKMSKKNYLL